MQDAASLAEAYEDLISDYCLKTVLTFCRESWLLPEEDEFVSSTLDRMIYADGDKNEIYSAEEREIIQSISELVFYCPNKLRTKRSTIDSRLVVLQIAPGYDPIYYSVALIKIINKAYDGFNVFLFSTKIGLLLGYAGLQKDISFRECFLSTPIGEDTNWELLSEVFLNRDDSLQFLDYYSGIGATIRAIQSCYYSKKEKNERFGISYRDKDYYEDPATPDLSAYLGWHNDTPNDDNDDTELRFIEFESDVSFCNAELAFIKKSRINPLELLYEAEAALILSDEQLADANNEPHANLDDSSLDTDYVDDPIELMKILRKKRGGI